MAQSQRQLSDDLFLAIAHPARRALVDMLLEREEVGAGELAEQLGLSPSALSQHLRVLKDAALVSDRRDGRNAYYRLTPEPLIAVVAWVRAFELQWQSRLDRLGAYLDRSRATAPTATNPQSRKTSRTPKGRHAAALRKNL